MQTFQHIVLSNCRIGYTIEPTVPGQNIALIEPTRWIPYSHRQSSNCQIPNFTHRSSIQTSVATQLDLRQPSGLQTDPRGTRDFAPFYRQQVKEAANSQSFIPFSHSSTPNLTTLKESYQETTGTCKTVTVVTVWASSVPQPSTVLVRREYYRHSLQKIRNS